jgi:hypothetical protein
MDPDTGIPEPEPSVFNYVLSFLLVGVAWGFTTPFIRRAAADFNARQEKANKPNYSGRGRSHSQEPETVFTDAGEEQELLSRGAQDSDSDEEGVRRRSTSSSDVNRKPKAAGADTGLDGGIAGQSGSGGTSEAREGSADEEQDDLPSPAWRRGAPVKQSWLRTKIVSIFWTVVNLLRTPAYAIPLVINLTGSIWFFLLVGKHGRCHFLAFLASDAVALRVELLTRYYVELSLTVPLANSSAFLFTVLGEWYVDRKVIAKETWLGMGLVLGGIALCVHSKNQAS